MGGSSQTYYTRCAAVFAGGCAAGTIAMMIDELYGSGEVVIGGWMINLLMLLYLGLAIWSMFLMAALRRSYPIL